MAANNSDTSAALAGAAGEAAASAIEKEQFAKEQALPYWLQSMRVEWVPSFPTGDPRANPEVGGRRPLRKIQWARGLRDDFRRKSKYYVSDWADGLRSPRKSLAAGSFLYFACLAPVIAFGGAMGLVTSGAMGISEVLISCGVCGMAYATIAGQPMTFVAPTGLTLAFTAALHRYCAAGSIPFLPMYAWVGLWTSGMLLFLAIINASGLIRFCTRFTEDVFNALLATNFIAEALGSIRAEFAAAASAADGFLAMNTAMLTAWLLQCTNAFRSKRYLNDKWREVIGDFGPPLVGIALAG